MLCIFHNVKFLLPILIHKIFVYKISDKAVRDLKQVKVVCDFCDQVLEEMSMCDRSTSRRPPLHWTTRRS